MMGKVISINIQKGGVGKTTTAHELASNLTALGYKVLAIDLDQQRNLSKTSGAAINAGYFTMYDVLERKCQFEDAIQEIGEEGEEGIEINVLNYDIAPAHPEFKSADNHYSGWQDVLRLKELINEQNLRDVYDYIIIDTPTSLGILPQMALAAADYLVIPCSASSFTTQGLGALYKEIEDQRRVGFSNVKIAGILLTKYGDRKVYEKAQKETLEEHAEYMGTRVFNTYIRAAVSVEEAQHLNLSLIQHDPKAKPADDYRNFTLELLEIMKNDEE